MQFFVFYISIIKCLRDIRIRLLISPKYYFENLCKHHEEAPLVTFKIDTSYPRSWYTCQVSRLRRDCHACGSKTAISRLLTPAFPFLMPGGKVWAFTALTDSFWKKIINYLNKLELMRENNDRTFAKSRILVGKATGDIVILVSFKWSKHRLTGHKSERLRNVSGNLWTSSEIVGHLRILLVPTKNLDTLRIKVSRLWITKSWQV